MTVYYWFSHCTTSYMNYFTCDVKQELQEKCAINALSGKLFENAVLVILFAISGFTSNDRAPGGPVTFWWPMWGQRLPKLQNVLRWPKCAKTAKKCAKLKKVPKSPKTALSGLARNFSEGVCVRVFCECQSIHPRPRQAQEPCPAFRSLLQLTPARSGPRSLA